MLLWWVGGTTRAQTQPRVGDVLLSVHVRAEAPVFVLRSEGIMPDVGAPRVDEAVAHIDRPRKTKINELKFINKQDSFDPEQMI